VQQISLATLQRLLREQGQILEVDP